MSADERAATRHRAAVIHRIRTLMEFWDITVGELRRFRPADMPRRPVLAKYRHPKTGETWDGKGPQPDWLRVALLRVNGAQNPRLSGCEEAVMDQRGFSSISAEVHSPRA